MAKVQPTDRDEFETMAARLEATAVATGWEVEETRRLVRDLRAYACPEPGGEAS
jgi:hypothetical protein